MFKTIISLVMILTLKCNLSVAIISETENKLSARQMGQSIALCFSQNLIRNCLENKIFDAIDKAIANNETWQFTDYLVVEKISTPNTIQNLSSEQEPSLSDALAGKLLQLAQTRAIKLQLPPMFMRTLEKRSFSSALDDYANNISNTDPDSEDNVGGGEEEQLEQEEGRRKKDKDKNMAMIGGMAMIAMVAQMFLGKVILIAGAAFVMAKVALLISVLGSLKKGSGGSGGGGGGGGTEHVIVTSGGGGGGGGGHSHEYSSGWHRSMPYDYNNLQVAPADEHKHTGPVEAYYEFNENDGFQRRNQQQVKQENKQMKTINYLK